MKRTLVIGCGNVDRGDDAAGILVVRRLRQLGMNVREESGEGCSLLSCWEGADDVIVVDAVVTGLRAGEIVTWDAHRERLNRAVFRGSTHEFGVADAVELGRILDRLPARLQIFGIEAGHFEAGAAPSPEVLEAVEDAARRISTVAV